jgi:hypothetical protein
MGFKRRHPAARHTENIEEGIPEGFGFGVLRAFFTPLMGELQGAGFDFIPA